MTWRPPQQLHTTDDLWRAMAEDDRQQVRDWLTGMGVTDLASVMGYTVQGDQLEVEMIHRRADGAAHLHDSCPDCPHPPGMPTCGRFWPNDLCTYLEVV